jgi:LPS export ABC transporter protein LptC
MPGSAGKDRGRQGLTRRTLPRTRRALAVIALAGLLAGCSIDYTSATAEDQEQQGVPDTIAIDILHRVHKDGHLSLELQASRAVSYDANKETVLSDARFAAYDEAGAKSTDGRAQTVVFHSDTENADISGGVRVHSASEKGEVSADSLYWENKTKKLRAPAAEQVIIRKDDGSSLSGTGFSGDFSRRELFFTGPVKGSYVWQEK